MGYTGKSDFHSGSSVQPGQTVSFGVPRTLKKKKKKKKLIKRSYLKILKISSAAFDPGNKARPIAISAKIHPADQTSIAVLYL